MQGDMVPKSDWILGLIEEIYAKGARRPGYPANSWLYDLTSLLDSFDGVDQR
jgi:hypothetical protein